jgi:transcriptional regulator with XRE-family HTH domain
MDANRRRTHNGRMSMTSLPVGTQLRDWRARRRLSQLELALDAEISTRHLSFVETGRAQPSREMILKLAGRLEIPLRDQNELLLAGGYAPVYREQSFESPALALERDAVQRILTGHEPYPALAIDRHWNMLAFNQAIGPLLTGIAPELLQPPVNVLRLSFHPNGLGPRIANLAEWRDHMFHRLDRHIARTGDAGLIDLRRELATYPVEDSIEAVNVESLLVPMVVRTPAGLLDFFHTTTVFGTPLEITLSELAIEAFFPANARTAELLRAMNAATAS